MKKERSKATNMIQILGISGSLSNGSSTAAVLNALASMTKYRASFVAYDGLEKIPPFHPQAITVPTEVARFRAYLSSSAAIIIATPEYAYGMPGVLKNALDWVVSSGELYQKPVVVVSVSTLQTGGARALLSLTATLSALGTSTPEALTLSIGSSRDKITKEGLVVDAETVAQLSSLGLNLLTML
jgi:NAD(P)H-dependent FMN reductase